MSDAKINAMIVDMLGAIRPADAGGLLGVFPDPCDAASLNEKDSTIRLIVSKRPTSRDEKRGEQLRQPQANDKLDKYANFLEPQDREEYSAVKLKLVQAGYHSKNAVRIYYFAQFVGDSRPGAWRHLCVYQNATG